MKNSKFSSVGAQIILLLIPLLYISAGFFFHSERGWYFMYSVDPEYPYLFNGLNLAQLTLKVWHVDHPGTPIQLLAALVIRVVHLFQGNGSLLHDVMQDSHVYAFAINITMFCMTAIALYFLGRVAFRNKAGMVQSIFLQLTPFASYLVLSLVFRINPENMLVFCFTLMAILIFKYLNREAEPVKKIDKYLLAFAFVTGLIIATKIIFLPMLFIPFFLFKGLLRKIYYVLFSFLAFLIMIIPVLIYRFSYFYEWIENLFIHSGKYGTGEAIIVDKNAFTNALQNTFTFEYFFSVSFAVFVIACIIYHLPAVKRKVRKPKYYQALLGITLCMLLTILLVAKQFAFHYLTPALLPVIFGIWLVVSIYMNRLKALFRNLIFLVLILVFMSFDYIKINEYHATEMKRKESLMKAGNFIKTQETGKPLVIISQYYGCPYPQYSLYFGLFWGGEVMKPVYVESLNAVFPNTYIYNGWDELFHNWNNDPFSYIELLKKHNKIRLYCGDSIVENDILKYSMYNLKRLTDTKIEKVFSDDKTHENIYDITYDPSLNTSDSITITCDAETLNSDQSFFIGSSGQEFKDGATQSSEKAFSGKYSSKLTAEKQYGMTYMLAQAKPGDHYRVSVWRHNDNRKAALVVSGRNSDEFYASGASPDVEQDGWGQIVIDFIVPEKMSNKEIRIYLYNDTGNPAYFDDLTITAYQ